MAEEKTKTLDDIQYDMSVLYDRLRDREEDQKVAGELANIAGKFMKAEQLKLARQIFMESRIPRAKETAASMASSD